MSSNSVKMNAAVCLVNRDFYPMALRYAATLHVNDFLITIKVVFPECFTKKVNKTNIQKSD